MVSMSDAWGTVIGAAGALLGVGLTGGFTLLQGRQNQLERDRDRDVQRQRVHQETRRAAYLHLLAVHHETAQKLEAAWVSSPAASQQAGVDTPLSKAETAVISLEAAVADVLLEGPPNVAEAAQAMLDACQELIFVMFSIRTAHPGSEEGLYNLASRSQEECDEERSETRRRFIQAARAAVGGNTPGLDYLPLQARH